MNQLRILITDVETEPSKKNLVAPRSYVAQLEAQIHQEEESINDVMSEMWASVDRQRALLAPFAKLDFDLSHHRSKS